MLFYLEQVWNFWFDMRANEKKLCRIIKYVYIMLSYFTTCPNSKYQYLTVYKSPTAKSNMQQLTCS